MFCADGVTVATKPRVWQTKLRRIIPVIGTNMHADCIHMDASRGHTRMSFVLRCL